MRANLVELNKIKVGAVSYLNTKPLLYGVKRDTDLMEQIELTEDYPAKIAEALINNTIDIGLVPVAVIPKIKNAQIISNYCIGAEQEVTSVCIFSNEPLENITEVILDYQSRTSVALAQVLLKNYWKKEVNFIPADSNFETKINGTTAAVVIGDRAFIQRKKCKYVYDLAEAWIDFTGLPFVFAAWVANKEIPSEFIEKFNEANAKGLTIIDTIVAENPYTEYDLKKYYTENISYELTDKKREGLNKFLEYLKEI